MLLPLKQTPLLFLLAVPRLVLSEITVYGQIPFGQTASATSSGAATATTLAAYNDTVLDPPAVPTPAPATAYTLDIQRDASAVSGLSIPHTGGGFFGFSIEMSVIGAVLGKNSTLINVPFLNLMANIQERAGGVLIRLGGNTQELAVMVDSLTDGHCIAKQDSNTLAPTETPAVLYTIDMLYMAANISALANVNWFIGVPFNDTTNWRFAIAEYAQAILGDNLIGMQVGNEPDLYASHGSRDSNYTVWDYFGEIAELIIAVDADDAITRKNIFVTPSVSGTWTPEDVWNTGFISAYVDNMYALAVEHYPNNNCYAQYGTGTYQDPQTEFPTYLTHMAGVDLCAPYLNSSAIALENGKPFMMFETNTASCGGFPGISNSYGAALWAMDYGMQMAYSNFSHAMLHVGGQNVFYNPFTAPPTNQSSYNEWTIGAIYYSALVLAEAFGETDTSRIIDLWGNSANVYTPSYAIYENDVLSKVALFNYVDDDTGASDLTVAISIPNSGVPSSVSVKYLECDSVSFINITWAGQTFGGNFKVDGRLQGDLNVTTVTCDQTSNVCNIPVKAPGFALVFMDTTNDLITLGQATQTYATTSGTKTANTATVNASVLATSNGHSGDNRLDLGSTSKGSASAATGGRIAMASGVMGLLAGVVGACFVMFR